jgi:hypothetical protein
MPRILIPVTDPVRAERAVRALIDEAHGSPLEIEVLLVAIAEPLTPGRIPLYLSPSRAEALAAEAARRWLAPLESILQHAGFRHRSMVRAGRVREIVAEVVQDEGVSRVLLPSIHRGLRGRREGERLAREAHLEVTVVG